METSDCTWCGKPLTLPFTCRVFTKDGGERVIENKIPDDIIDGHGAIVILLHNRCGSKGSDCGRISITSTGRPERKFMYHSAPRLPEPNRSAAARLTRMGFDVLARGYRLLRVLPAVRVEEVKRLY